MAASCPKFSRSGHFRSILLAGLALPIAATSAEAALTIATSATKNVNCSNGVCSAIKANAILNASDLQNMLSTSGVQVVSGNIAGAIDVKAALSWASANTLTLDAYTSITVDKPVAVAGSGNLTLTTNDGGSGGALSFGTAGYVTFWSTSDHLTVNGAAYTLVDNIHTLAEGLSANLNGNYALAESYNASADGAYAQAPLGSGFSGTFQGLGNTISNLTIVSDRTQYVGLFGQTDGATIAYLHLVKTSIQAKRAITGGLVGNLDFGEIAGCSMSGKVATVDGTTGGLVGLNGGTISDSWSAAKVTGSSNYAGGLVGYNENTVTASYATGDVSSNLSGADIGGLIGNDASNSMQVPGAGVSNSYATGAVTGIGVNSYVGGLEGYSSDPSESDNLSLSGSYSTGSVAGGAGSAIGGLAGYKVRDSSNNYWDTTTSGITNTGEGCGVPSSCSGVTGQTTSQLQAGLPTGFSSAIWGESPSINGGLPYLLAIPPK